MEEYLTTLRLNDVEDLKERVLGSAAFLTCWPVYRDEYFWSDDRQVGTRGNNEPTISARVVAELGLRNRSRYAYGIAGPAFRLHWTPLDYDIWLYSQLISMLGTPGQLLESRQVSERKIICEALACVIRQIKYDYNPNRRGALARFIEKASPSELHKGKSRQILNIKEASLKPDAKRLAVLCGGKGGLIVPQHPSNIVINPDTTADGANIRNNVDIDGVSGKERLKRLKELVNELPLTVKKQFRLCERISGANFSRGYADEAIVPIADQEIRVLDDLIHNARWNVLIGEDATEESIDEDPEARILRMQAAMTSSERDSFKEGTKWLNNLSDPKISLSDARDILGIKQDAEFPRVGSLRSGMTLKSYQIQGSAWIIRMLLSSVRGAILADEMGLGKTYQVISAIARLVELRQAEPSHLTVEKFGPPGPILVACPSGLVGEWVNELTTRLPRDFEVVRYDKSVKQPIPKTDKRLDPDGSYQMVFVASFETLQQKHSYQAWDKKSKKGLTAQTFSEWDYNLNDSFWVVAIDEAHQLKQAWSGKKNITVTSIRAWGKIAITGTPIVQDVGDAAGLAGLILPRTNLWADLNVSKTIDPYTFADGTPEAILQATGEGIMGFVKGRGDIEAGRRIHRAFQQILLSRKYSTVDETGKTIAESVPPMKTQTIRLQPSPESRSMLNALMEDCKTKLLTFKNTQGKGRALTYSPIVIRNVSQATLFYPFQHVKWDGTKTLKKIRKELEAIYDRKQRLRALLVRMHDHIGHKMGFDPNEHTDEGLLEQVAARSPKLKYLAWDLAVRVLVQGRKVLIWTNYPWSQLFVETWISAFDIDCAGYHAHLTDKERQSLSDDFNDHDGTPVLVASYAVGGEGLNWQRACFTAICLQCASSESKMWQALYRIRRIGQEEEQNVSFYQIHGTIDFAQVMYLLSRQFTSFFAWVNDTREEEKTDGTVEPIMMTDEEKDRFTTALMQALRGLESVTDPATDPATGPVTNPATNPVTDPATDSATDSATDPAADPAADHVTDPVTDPATKPGVEPATEPVKKSRFPLDPPLTDAQIRKWVIELDAAKDEILSDVKKGLTTYLTNDCQAFYVKNRRRFKYALGDRFTLEWAHKYPEFLP